MYSRAHTRATFCTQRNKFTCIQQQNLAEYRGRTCQLKQWNVNRSFLRCYRYIHSFSERNQMQREKRIELEIKTLTKNRRIFDEDGDYFDCASYESLVNSSCFRLLEYRSFSSPIGPRNHQSPTIFRHLYMKNK